ncbi:MAG: hypothetical protein ACYC21_09825, partial [Eubacteriales bacterium]
VKKCNDILKEKGPLIDACVIIGFSYSEADEMEFNQLVEFVHHPVDFYIIDKTPSLKLEAFLKQKGHNVFKRSGLPW